MQSDDTDVLYNGQRRVEIENDLLAQWTFEARQSNGEGGDRPKRFSGYGLPWGAPGIADRCCNAFATILPLREEVAMIVSTKEFDIEKENSII